MGEYTKKTKVCCEDEENLISIEGIHTCEKCGKVVDMLIMESNILINLSSIWILRFVNFVKEGILIHKQHTVQKIFSANILPSFLECRNYHSLQAVYTLNVKKWVSANVERNIIYYRRFYKNDWEI